MLNIDIKLVKTEDAEVGDYILTPHNSLYRIIRFTKGYDNYYTLLSVVTGKTRSMSYNSVEDVIYYAVDTDDRIIKAEDLKITNR